MKGDIEMDFTYYPNTQARVAELGKVKTTAFNKKTMQKAEESWQRITQEEMMQIEYEIQGAVKIGSALFMPSAVIIWNSHTLSVLPARDIIWVYGYVQKTSMNLIPTSKAHYVYILPRSGETQIIYLNTTGGFSKKDLSGDAVKQIYNIMYQSRKGAFFGYSDEIANYVKGNFAAAVQYVDAKSMQ